MPRLCRAIFICPLAPPDASPILGFRRAAQYYEGLLIFKAHRVVAPTLRLLGRPACALSYRKTEITINRISDNRSSPRVRHALVTRSKVS